MANNQAYYIFDEVQKERTRQDAEWGGPEHDDRHNWWDWCEFIQKQVETCTSGVGKPPDYKERMIKIAALAVAAIESNGRRSAAITNSPDGSGGHGSRY